MGRIRQEVNLTTKNAEKAIGTSQRVNSGRIAGDWYARATCGASSIIVEVARRKKGIWTPLVDPLNARKTWDFATSPPNPIFGDDTATTKRIKLCEDAFSGGMFFDLQCVSFRHDEAYGANSDSTYMVKCPNRLQVMTECRAILFPIGDKVCGTNTAVGRDPANGRVYCTTHGCNNGDPLQFWGTQVTCCTIVH